MPRDGIGKKVAKSGMGFDGMLRSGGGVIDFASDFGGMDVGF
jgi:hypothetical protein